MARMKKTKMKRKMMGMGMARRPWVCDGDGNKDDE
jgi:hypothetical protein